MNDEGDGSDDGRGRRPSRSPSSRVTLQFSGPKLTLPGEPTPDEPLRLDTSEFAIPPADDAPPLTPVPEAEPPSLELDLEGLDPGSAPDAASERATPADGWGRLRGADSSAPSSRGRSVTPPPSGDALDLVAQRSRPPSTPGIDLVSEMSDRYALGDFTGALRVAELVLGKSPDDLRAQRCAESSRERLIALYSARLASLGPWDEGTVGARVPQVQVPEHEIRWLGLDHRQGFLLSRLDGKSSIEDLVDLTGMTRLEVLKTLVELVEAAAVRIE